MVTIPPWVLLGFLAAGAIFARASVAAETPSGVTTLHEVVVTARKREESLQDVPAAVTAFSGEKLETLNVGDTLQLLNSVPSASFEDQNGSTSANIYLRGIGSNGPGSNVVSGVGIYADDVSLNSPVVNVLQLYDLERVEVLRGPQNTLYGRNTTGGAINYISRKPVIGEIRNGYLAATFGRWDQRDLSAAIASGLGARAAVRLAVDYQYRDGVYRNVFRDEDAYDRDKVAGRLQFRIAPIDTLDILLKLHAERVDNGNKLWQGIGLRDPSNPTQPCPRPAELGNGCADINGFVSPGDRTHYAANLDPIESVDSGGGSLTVNWALGRVALTSITAYEENDYVKTEDVDTGPALIFDFGTISNQSQWSEEIRLASVGAGRLRWVAGVFAFDEQLWSNTTAVIHANGRANATRLDQDNRVYSAYAELEWAATEAWSVIAGARYTEETKQGVNDTAARLLSNAAVQVAILPVDGQAPPTIDDLLPLPSGRTLNIPFDRTWGDWGGKLGLRYRLGASTIAYGHVARGFKAGIFSNAPLQTLLGTFLPPADPEYLTSFELGFKTTSEDGRLRTNLAAYYYDYKDQQLLVTAEIGGQPAAAYTNAGSSTIYGAELEAAWVPARDWLLQGSVSWLRSRLNEYVDFTGIDYSGVGLQQAPKWTANVSVDRTWNLSGGGALGLSANARYTASRRFSLDRDPRTTDGAFTVVNAAAYYDFGARQQYRLSLWGKNLTDDTWLVGKAPFDAAGTIEAQVSEPPSYGVTLRLSL